MVTLSNPPMAVITMLFIVALFLPYLHSTEAQVGVCYGKLGSDLPSPEQVVKLYKDNCISAMRLYEPDVPTLEALRGSDIKLMLGVRNADIEKIGCYQSAADEWVEKFVTPYAESIKYIAVGNEIKPSYSEAPYVKRAMENILNALNNSPDQQLQSCDIKVSTAISLDLIKNSANAPSNAEFIDTGYIGPIIEFLAENDSPLLANIQPFLAYQKDHFDIKYLIFTAGDTVFFTDPNNNLDYHNLFDAMLDSVYAAVGKVSAAAQKEARGGRGGGFRVASSETGGSSGQFPHSSKGWDNLSRRQNGGVVQQEAGDELTNSEANAFYANLIEHVKGGTPLKPGEPIETYLFAMFDENLKQGDETEKYYGLFTANGTPKYQHPCLKFN